MRAHLEFYGEFWNSLLPDERHEHEVGEDRSGCANCQLEERWQQMSDFERACWNWYTAYANPLTITSGLMSSLAMDEWEAARVAIQAEPTRRSLIDRLLRRHPPIVPRPEQPKPPLFAKRLFIRALGMIHATVERVAHERARMAAKAQEG